MNHKFITGEKTLEIKYVTLHSDYRRGLDR
jgi:hypothetical protein